MKYRSAQRKLRIAKYLDRFPEIGAMTQRHAEAYLSNKLRSRMSLRNPELSTFGQGQNSMDTSSTDSTPGSQHDSDTHHSISAMKTEPTSVNMSEPSSPNLIKIPRKLLYTSSLTESDSLGERALMVLST